MCHEDFVLDTDGDVTEMPLVPQHVQLAQHLLAVGGRTMGKCFDTHLSRLPAAVQKEQLALRKRKKNDPACCTAGSLGIAEGCLAVINTPAPGLWDTDGGLLSFAY